MRQLIYTPERKPVPSRAQHLCVFRQHSKQPTRYLLLFTFLAFSCSAHAQSNGSLEGQVTDQNGAVVAGAEINAVSREIGILRTSTTDDAGRYQIAALPVGPYRLEVKARGFQTQIIEN